MSPDDRRATFVTLHNAYFTLGQQAVVDWLVARWEEVDEQLARSRVRSAVRILAAALLERHELAGGEVMRVIGLRTRLEL